MIERQLFKRTVTGEERRRAAELEGMKDVAILEFPTLQLGRVKILAFNVYAELAQKNGVLKVKSQGRVETIAENVQD